jgi:hypothetical protein
LGHQHFELSQMQSPDESVVDSLNQQSKIWEQRVAAISMLCLLASGGKETRKKRLNDERG